MDSDAFDEVIDKMFNDGFFPWHQIICTIIGGCDVMCHKIILLGTYSLAINGLESFMLSFESADGF